MKISVGRRVFGAVLLVLAGILPVFGGDVIYVDIDAPGVGDGSSWLDAYNGLQDALAVAGADQEIRVAGGAYQPDQGAFVTAGDRLATFQLKSGVVVYGGYAGFGEAEPNSWDVVVYETVLSGDLAGDDGVILYVNELLTDPGRGENSYHVVTATGTDATAVLEGFTIKGGNANGSGDESGGGLYNNGGDATINDCFFTENQADWYGGAISNESANPDIYGCVFFMNTAEQGGAIDNYVSGGAVSYCAFVENFAIDDGGAVSNDGSGSDAIFAACRFEANEVYNNGGAMANLHSAAPQIVGCDFEDNIAGYGGAVYMYDSSGTVFVNSRFLGNWSDAAGWAGVAFILDSNAAFANCMFSGNWAYVDWPAVSYGGVLYSYANDANCSITIDDCTFSDNVAFEGSSIACDSSGPSYESTIEINNSILWSGGDEIWNNDSSTIAISYSDVQDGSAGDGTVYAGVGNIDGDPQFIDADGVDGFVGTIDDDLRLALSSPCIDAGDDTAVPADTADLDGDGDLAERLPIDLGGWNRFTNEPGIVDTGVADLPTYMFVVDMGAYETEGSVYFADPNLQAAVEAELGITDPYAADMLGLIMLDANDLGISDLTGLEFATNLTELDLHGNEIVDISPLSGLTGLTYLNLWINQISDISSLSGLTSLTNLNLWTNQISDISGLSELSNLAYLDLNANQISDMSSLSGLTSLTQLCLGDNQIIDISVLSELTNLDRLHLFKNQISDISSLSGLTSLTHLGLGDNQIIDISVLSELTNLTHLGLWSNQISDISVLTSMDALVSLLWLDGNHLNTSAYCVDMDVIRGNNPGIHLIYDANPNPIMDDCSTDLGDLGRFGAGWLMTGCSEGNGWCGGADFDHLDDVGDGDLLEFAGYWLADI